MTRTLQPAAPIDVDHDELPLYEQQWQFAYAKACAQPSAEHLQFCDELIAELGAIYDSRVEGETAHERAQRINYRLYKIIDDAIDAERCAIASKAAYDAVLEARPLEA